MIGPSTFLVSSHHGQPSILKGHFFITTRLVMLRIRVQGGKEFQGQSLVSSTTPQHAGTNDIHGLSERRIRRRHFLGQSSQFHPGRSHAFRTFPQQSNGSFQFGHGLKDCRHADLFLTGQGQEFGIVFSIIVRLSNRILPGEFGRLRLFRYLDGRGDGDIGQSCQGIVGDFGPGGADIVLEGQKEPERMGIVSIGMLNQLIQIDLQFGRALQGKFGRLLGRGFFQGTGRMLFRSTEKKSNQ